MELKKIIAFVSAAVISATALITPIPAFADDESNVNSPAELNSSDMTMEAENSLGELLADAVESKTNEQKENQGCNIFSIEMDGKNANVSFETLEDCTIVVGIFDEQGEKMLYSGSKEVKKGETETTVEIETDSMPAYYYLKGFMIRDTDFTPLCTNYSSPNYTKEMQDFFAKTTDDFEEDKVLNLDDDKNKNFAVFSDDVKIIEPVSGKNTVVKADIDNDIYVIENADSSITSLQSGDTFSYEYETGNFLIVNIDTINVDGNTVSITGADTSMENVFDYVKIDSCQGLEEAEIDTSSASEGVIFNDINQENVLSTAGNENSFLSNNQQFYDLGVEPSLSITYNGASGWKLKASLSCDNTFKFYVSTSYQYIELKYDFELKFSLTGSVSTPDDISISLGSFIFPTGTGVVIEVPLSIDVKLTGSINATATLNLTIGFAYDSDAGFNDLTNSKFKAEPKVEINFYVGLSIEPQVYFLTENILKTGFKGKAGTEVKATLSPTDSVYNQDYEHSCAACLDGDINLKIGFSVDLEIFNNKILSAQAASDVLNAKIADFYYSYDNNEFGWTTCPYIKYKTLVTVTDQKGNPIKNAAVYDNYRTDENGQVMFYLKNGGYTITAKKAGYYSQSEDITILDGAKEITLTLTERSDADINQTISMNDYHSAAITEDGKLYTWGRDDSGELGDGAEDIENYYNCERGTKNSLIPYHALNNIRSVSVGSSNIAAITTDGRLYMSGDNEYGLIGNGKYDFEKLAVGLDHRRYHIENNNKFQYVYALGHNVASVSMGVAHCGAVTKNGTLYMWGNNDYGQIGINEETPFHQLFVGWFYEPFDIPRKVMDNVKMVSCGQWNTAAVTLDGDLYIWGSWEPHWSNIPYDWENTSSPIYNRKPKKILENVDFVKLGDRIGMAVTKDGELYIWCAEDSNFYIQDENNDLIKTSTLTPTKAYTFDQKIIAVYPDQNAFITEKGELYQWETYISRTWLDGDNESYSRIYKPTKITGQIADNVSQLSGNSVRYVPSCCFVSAVTKDGKLYMKGSNTYGQLGDGTTTESAVPKRVYFDEQDKKILQFDSTEESDSEENTEPQAVSSAMIKCSAYSGNADNNDSVQETESVNQALTEQALYSVSSDENTYTFNGLEGNKEYIFYIMKSRSAPNPFDSNNLLYIAQGVSDENGNISFEAYPKSNVSDADIFVGGEPARDINDAEITVSDIRCDAKEHCQTCKVVYNGKTLLAGEDYDVTGDFFVTDPGTYSLTITGIGDYTGTVKKEFSVKQDSVADMTITLSKTAYAYTGNAAKPKVTVQNGSETLTLGADYAVKYENNVNAGTAKVIIAGKGIYTGRVTKTFKIIDGVTDISDCTVSIPNTAYPYTGKAVKPAVTVKDGDTILVNSTDYVMRYENNVDLGTASIVVSGKGKYIGTTIKTFEILNDFTKCSVTIPSEKYAYTGSAIKPKVTVKYGNTALALSADYAVRYVNNINEGTASVVVAGRGNYTGTITKTFEILDNVTDICDCAISIPKTAYAYNGSAIKPKVTVKNGNTELVLSTDYSLRYVNNINVGTASIIISGKGNYIGTAEKTFEILNDFTKCSVTIPDNSYDYTGSAVKPKVTVKDGSRVLTLNTDYAVRYTNNVNVGTASIIIAGRGKYTGSITKTFKIADNRIDIAVCTVTLPKTSYAYTGSAIKPKVTVTNGNETLTLSTDYLVRYTNNVNAGTASIIIAGQGKYKGSAEQTFVITE